MDLDKKLREMLFNHECPLDKNEHDNLIAQIKQAFEDANYVQLPTVRKEIEAGLTVNGKIVMTGAEWLERFEKELKEYDKLDKITVKLAARRASGVNDE